MRKVVFLPSNIEAECEPNENIFKVAKRIGLKILTACNGLGNCGLCRVQVIENEECLNQLTRAENKHLGNVYFINKKRLACQCKFIADGTTTLMILE